MTKPFDGRPIGATFNDPRVPCCGRDAADCDCEVATSEHGHTAYDVARHYASLPRTIARPAEVTIDGQTYPSAIVEQERDTPRGSRAYLEGERTYVHRAIVCVGRLPETYASRDVRAYQRADGSRWYVAGYWQGAPGSEYSHLYPFGRMFQLMRDEHGVTLSNQYGRPYSAARLARITRPVEIRELAEVSA